MTEPDTRTDTGRIPGKVGNSHVAIGTATCFVIIAALVSLAFDRPSQIRPTIGDTWTLRGAV
jgi:hypothetical protein